MQTYRWNRRSISCGIWQDFRGLSSKLPNFLSVWSSLFSFEQDRDKPKNKSLPLPSLPWDLIKLQEWLQKRASRSRRLLSCARRKANNRQRIWSTQNIKWCRCRVWSNGTSTWGTIQPNPLYGTRSGCSHKLLSVIQLILLWAEGRLNKNSYPSNTIGCTICTKGLVTVIPTNGSCAHMAKEPSSLPREACWDEKLRSTREDVSYTNEYLHNDLFLIAW